MLAGMTVGRPDVVINFGPPLVGPAISAFIARARRSLFITVIYDIYPDVAIESGAVRNRAVIWLAKALERWIYRKSDRLVVLSEGFRKTLQERREVSGRKIRVIPVWIDTGELRNPPVRNKWRVAHGISDGTFLVMYAGTMGIVSGAEVMAGVAREFSEDPDILFLFVGEGKKKDAVREKAAGLRNVRFLDFQPREHVAAMLASADVGVMTLRPGAGRMSVPSKILAYMAMEVPVLASCDADSDSARIVCDAGCGMVVEPGDHRAISHGLRTLRSDFAYRCEAGKRGRAYVEKFHSLDYGTKAFRRLIDEMSDGNATTG